MKDPEYELLLIGDPIEKFRIYFKFHYGILEKIGMWDNVLQCYYGSDIHISIDDVNRIKVKLLSKQ